MAGISEFENHCTFLIHPSCLEYASPLTSFAGSLAQAAGVTEKFMMDTVLTPSPNVSHQANVADLQKRLESSRDSVKLEALKEVILWTVQGRNSPVEFHGIIGGGSISKNPTNVASRLLVTIIRYVLPSENHQIKRYLQLYWETVDKAEPDGSLKEEMILVCNRWRQDLLHPNEYIRGTTLRLLSKMRYINVLQPLIESITQNINNPHTYVRRNAIMCEYVILGTFGKEVISRPAQEIIELLSTESDVSCKRNLFLILMHCDMNRAADYVLSLSDRILYMGDMFQLSVLHFLRRLFYKDVPAAQKLLPLAINLVNNCTAPAVCYEGAQTLLCFSSTSSALVAATRGYVNLLLREAENNIKISVLDRLQEILESHPAVLEDFAVDICRVLSSLSHEIRKKALAIGFKLVTPRTAPNIFAVIRKEIRRTLNVDNQQLNQASISTYQQLILQHLNSIGVEYASAIMPMLKLLLEFLMDRPLQTATELMLLIHKLVTYRPEMRGAIVEHLLEALPTIPYASVSRSCLWILGEFSSTATHRQNILDTIFTSLLPFPFTESIEDRPMNDLKLSSTSFSGSGTTRSSSPTLNTGDSRMKVTIRTVVLQDGTYGTKNIYDKEESRDGTNEIAPTSGGVRTDATGLRSLVLSPDFLLASVVALTDVKVFVKLVCSSAPEHRASLVEKHAPRCLLLVTSLYKICSTHSCWDKTSATAARILQAIHVLLSIKKDPSSCDELFEKWFSFPQENFLRELHTHHAYQEQDVLGDSSSSSSSAEEVSNERFVPPEQVIQFRQSEHLQEPHQERRQKTKSILHPDLDLKRALGKDMSVNEFAAYQQRMMKIQQLTGLDDPLYIEAYIEERQFNFTIEFFFTNRLEETLQNVSIELLAHGDLKLVEQPRPFNLSPGMSRTVRTILRVTSTETSSLFGHVTFHRSPKGETEHLVLNELHIDLLGLIRRCQIDSSTFHTMWAEFEWENKIAINTCFTDIAEYIEHLVNNTKMSLIGTNVLEPPADQPYPNALAIQTDHSPDVDFAETLVYPSPCMATKLPSPDAVDGEHPNAVHPCLLHQLHKGCSFFSVNMYCKSIFGEDTLANVSIEKLLSGKLSGNIRIRSRTQGIALSLGDAITILQRCRVEQTA